MYKKDEKEEGDNNKLVSCAKGGDKEAFVELIEQNKQSMYKVARSYLHNDEDVADVLQESILKCYQAIGSLREDSYFKTWLIRIVINESVRFHKKKKREVTYEEMPVIYHVENGYGNTEFTELLDSISPKYRTVLLLYYNEGYCARKIAEMLNMNQVTVRSRLSRGRKLYAQLCEISQCKGKGSMV